MSEGDLFFRLAHPGEDDLARVAAGLQRAEQLALADDVDAAAQSREGAEDRQIGIALHRVADQVRNPGEGFVEDLEVPRQGRVRVDVDRRADRLGDLGDGDLFGVEDVFLVLEVVHGAFAIV